MIIGVPSEIKNNERRVGMTPESVAEVIAHGHSVLVQAGAGAGIGAADADYQAAGATTVATAADAFAADMVVKVKEPQAAERAMLRTGQTLFAYLHLAPDADQTRELIASGVTAVAYETVTGPLGGLPLLAPMSQVAGRLAVQAGAHALESPAGGRGILLGGVPGVPPASVVIIGGGVAGSNAATIAFGMGAKVTVLDRSAAVLERLDDRFGSHIITEYATRSALVRHLATAVPGARVLVDGRYLGDTPIEVEIEAGPRAVQVSRPGYKDFFENVMAVAGEDIKLDATLEELPPEVNPYREQPAPPPKWYQKKWVWGVIAGVGLVAIGGAVTGGVLGSQDQDPLSRADFRFDLTR